MVFSKPSQLVVPTQSSNLSWKTNWCWPLPRMAFDLFITNHTMNKETSGRFLVQSPTAMNVQIKKYFTPLRLRPKILKLKSYFFPHIYQNGISKSVNEALTVVTWIEMLMQIYSQCWYNLLYPLVLYVCTGVSN